MAASSRSKNKNRQRYSIILIVSHLDNITGVAASNYCALPATDVCVVSMARAWVTLMILNKDQQPTEKTGFPDLEKVVYLDALVGALEDLLEDLEQRERISADDK
jgi:hypothetical protein